MFPRHYYNNEASGQGVTYTRSGRGPFDVDKLVAGKPAFISRGQTLEKKVIVFADWSAKTWRGRKFDNRYIQIELLLKQGFNILVVTADEYKQIAFSPLLIENLPELFTEKTANIPVTTHAELARLIKQGLIPEKEEFLILDHKEFASLDRFQLNRFEKENITPAKDSHLSIEVESFQHLTYEEKIYLIHDIVNEGRGYNTLTHSTFSRNENQEFQRIASEFPTLTCDHSYTKAKLTLHQIDKLIEKGTFVEDNTVFNVNDLHAINELYISANSNNLNDEYYPSKNPPSTTHKPLRIETILKTASEIRILELNGVNINCKHKPNTKSTITSVIIRNTDINTGTLEAIGDMMPDLERMSIGGENQNIKFECTLPKNRYFPKLHLLFIEKINASDESLKSILQQSNQLETLKINKANLKTPGIFDGIDFSKMKKLIIEKCEISIENFVFLIDQCCHLNSLTILDGVTFSGEIPEDKYINIKINRRLKKIICHSQLPVGILEFLSLNAPNITFAIFEDLDFTAETAKIFCGWTELKSLELNDCEIIAEYFNQLLTALQKLKTLTLINIILEANTISPSMPNLTSLTFMNSEMEAGTFYQMLHAAPNLQKLSIQDLALQRESVALPLNFNLPNLSLIYYSRIGSELVLKNITSASPGLKILSIDCKVTALLLNHLKTLPQLFMLQFKTHLNPNSITEQLKNHLPNTYLIGERQPASPASPATPNTKAMLASPKKIKSPHVPLSAATNATFFRQKHNRKYFLQCKLRHEPYQFFYDITKFSMNQDMIIHQCSQYMTLKNRDVAFIEKMIGGICEYISHLFLTTSLDEWIELVNKTKQWDGTLQNLTPTLEDLFKKMSARKNHINVSNIINQHNRYLGKDVDTFFTGRIGNFYVSNPWHTIGVKRDHVSKPWLVLDPNAEAGEERVESTALASVLREILGVLICVNDTQTLARSNIENPNEFIAEGGLILFDQMSNPGEKAHLQQQLQLLIPMTFEKDALNGILLRHSEEPAWIIAINSDNQLLQNLGINLLCLYVAHYPDYIETLRKSAENLTPFERHHTFENILKLFNVNNHSTLTPLLEDFRIILLYAEISNQLTPVIKTFQTWAANESNMQDKNAFCQFLTSGKQNKLLIEAKSTYSQNNLSIILQKYCQSTSKPFLYIDSPHQLSCLGNYLECENKMGRLKKGPGGRLFNFINNAKTHGETCIIIINFLNFLTNDIVNTNTITDKIRHVEGINLPDNIVVIGITNDISYREGDFYTRYHDVIEPHPNMEKLGNHIKTIPEKDKDDDSDTFVMDFFNSNLFEKRLLGGWVINKKVLTLGTGMLDAALASGKVIEIRNGHWDSEFTYFWRQALTLGKIKTAHGEWDISNAQFVRSSGYDWQALLKVVDCYSGLHENGVTMNSTYLNEFHESKIYDFDESTIDMVPGVIYQHANDTLIVNVMGYLSEDDWAEFLHVCCQQNVTVKLYFAVNIDLPNVFKAHGIKMKTETTNNDIFIEQKHTAIIITDDCDAEMRNPDYQNRKWVHINVDAIDIADLLMRTHCETNIEEGFLQFTQKEGALLRAIANNENIMLYGNFTNQHAEGLMPLLFNRFTSAQAQGLVCILANAPCRYFDALPINIFTQTLADKKVILGQQFLPDLVNAVTSEMQNAEIAKIHSIVSFAARMAPNSTINDPWLGFKNQTVKPSQREKMPIFDLESDKASANTFIQNQFNKMYAILNDEPTVFLGGTNFLLKRILIGKLLSCFNTVLYTGKDEFKTFLTDKSDARKIFIVTNAYDFPSDIFNDLYQDPPTITDQGITYPCNNHKVVFIDKNAPRSANGKLASIFDLHGNSIVVDEFTLEYIYVELLMPIFENKLCEADALNASKFLIEIYCIAKDVSNYSDLTPLALQMIALLAANNIAKKPNQPFFNTLFHYLKLLHPTLVNSPDIKQFIATHCPNNNVTSNNQTVERIGNYIVLPSRKNTCEIIDDFIALHEARFSQHGEMNEQQLFGGQSGLALEGEPGIGKSEMMIAKLVSRGYREIHLPAAITGEKTFIRIPANMPKAEKDRAKSEATKNGVIMLFDEFNCAVEIDDPFVYSMNGKRLNGKRPDTPGAISFIMQNGRDLAGRASLSTELEEQLAKNYLAPYSCTELVMFLKWRGVDGTIAKVAAQAFIEHVEHAKKYQLKPVPSFRNFERHVETMLQIALTVQQEDVPDRRIKRGKN